MVITIESPLVVMLIAAVTSTVVSRVITRKHSGELKALTKEAAKVFAGLQDVKEHSKEVFDRVRSYLDELNKLIAIAQARGFVK